MGGASSGVPVGVGVVVSHLEGNGWRRHSTVATVGVSEDTQVVGLAWGQVHNVSLQFLLHMYYRVIRSTHVLVNFPYSHLEKSIAYMY